MSLSTEALDCWTPFRVQRYDLIFVREIHYWNDNKITSWQNITYTVHVLISLGVGISKKLSNAIYKTLFRTYPKDRILTLYNVYIFYNIEYMLLILLNVGY